MSANGWIAAARRIDSPNFDERPHGAPISLVVIHAISLPPQAFGSDNILQLFTNTLDPAAHPYFADISHLRVSAHFLIRRTGELIQFVSCLKRAWHAGVSSWQDQERCNDFSIGIELEGCDTMPFEIVQYEQLNLLLQMLYQQYPLAHIAGHSDIAPGRKTDPGPCFDWRLVSSLGEAPNPELGVPVAEG